MIETIDVPKKSHSVRFNPIETLHTVEPLTHHSASEKIETWYGWDDMTHFKKAANMSARLHQCPSEAEKFTHDLSFYKCLDGTYKDSLSTPCYQLTDMANYEKSRGLETRMSADRTKFRRVARLAVLEIQRRIINRGTYTKIEKEASIAKIAEKFSRWAKEIALRVAKMDTCAVNFIENNFVESCRKEFVDLPLNLSHNYPAAKRMRISSSYSPTLVRSL